MKKTLLTLTALALAMTSTQASVVINSTNFPDEAFRAAIADRELDQNGDGTLSDEELGEVNYWELHDVENFKGLEHFTSIEALMIGTFWKEGPLNATNLDITPLKKLWRFDISNYAISSIDFSANTSIWSVQIINCPNLTSFKAPISVTELTLGYLPSLTSIDFSIYSKLERCFLQAVAAPNIDFSNHPTLQSLMLEGTDETLYTLNSLNVAGCPELNHLALRRTKTASVSLKNLPKLYALDVNQCETSSLTVLDMPELGGVTCESSDIKELNIKNCPELSGINCTDNKLQTLIVDDSPKLYSVGAANNKLMWLDMSHVQRVSGEDANWFIVDNQQPTVQAVKISPTEVGLRVHDRLDVSRVLSLRAKGIAQTPKEIFVDGIRYFVFYDNGPDTPNLVGSDCGYLYDTKWPYVWQEGSENTKDHRLPVTLRVTSWTKHPSWIKLQPTSDVTGLYDKSALNALTPPTVLRSQDYDGKITFSSSNENVVKVDPNTGALTIVGPGTAYITVSGAETDYRLAPASVSYKVIINYMVGDVNGDGEIGIADIVAITNVMAGNETNSGRTARANVNGDTSVGIADIVAVTNIMAGN